MAVSPLTITSFGKNKIGEISMADRKDFISFQRYGWHKGFYNDDDINKSLSNIYYEDFFEYPDDEEFPYTAAWQLLMGSCNHFALGLKNVLGYTPYIIHGDNKVSFHSFCQIYKKGTWYYIDARGITTSFDEFMEVAREFVSDKYTIRAVDDEDYAEWKDDNYYEEALAFAEAVIEKFKECYTL